MEPLVYRGVRHIVVPSRGLDREIAAAYQNSAAKARVLPNPVDVEQMRMPDDFDRNAMRTRLGYLPEDLVLIFIALGHFERKGLPLLLNSLKSLGNQRIRLLVVGGTQDTVDWWRGRINQLELAGRVQLLGMQSDVRPYLWSSDVFTLPSYYEVFPLVALEAAAAGLPLLVTSLNGVEEFLIPEKNGLLVERTAESMTGGLKRLGALPEQALREMGRRAQEDVQQYATRHFVSRWRDFYEASYVVG
jgi:glycosyltransferase involved in cell wall biosynthesis